MEDLNFIFDIDLDVLADNPSLKRDSLAYYIKLKEELDISDIFRVRHLNTKKVHLQTKNEIQ